MRKYISLPIVSLLVARGRSKQSRSENDYSKDNLILASTTGFVLMAFCLALATLELQEAQNMGFMAWFGFNVSICYGVGLLFLGFPGIFCFKRARKLVMRMKE